MNYDIYLTIQIFLSIIYGFIFKSYTKFSITAAPPFFGDLFLKLYPSPHHSVPLPTVVCRSNKSRRHCYPTSPFHFDSLLLVVEKYIHICIHTYIADDHQVILRYGNGDMCCIYGHSSSYKTNKLYGKEDKRVYSP